MSWISASIGTLQQVVTTIAVLVGGGWAYLKFVRGRVFAPRADLSVSAALYRAGAEWLLLCQVTVENRGLTRLPLQPLRQVVYLYEVQAAQPEKTGIALIFEGHRWIEPQECISGEALFRLLHSGSVPAVYRVEAEVWGARRWLRRGGPRWLTAVTVLGEGWRARQEEIDGQVPGNLG